MPRIGTLELDPEITAVKETRERREDGWHRQISVTGLAPLCAPAAAREAFLDALWAAAAADETGSVTMSLRPGRTVSARALRLTRENLRTGGEGAFSALFEGLAPWEEAESPTTALWNIASQGAETAVCSAGTLPAPLTLAFTAAGAVYYPSFSDGVRTLVFPRSVAAGSTLLVDGPLGRVTLDGADVTALCSGSFPRIGPAPGTTLLYVDDPDSAHTGVASLSWRDRWV